MKLLIPHGKPPEIPSTISKYILDIENELELSHLCELLINFEPEDVQVRK